MSIHWGVAIADGVAVLALIVSVPSVLYARRADGRADRADKRAEKAEQRIAAEEKRNAVRWQLELSHDPAKLWLRNVGTQNASHVSILDPGAPLVQLAEPGNWVVPGGAVAVMMNDPGKTVTSLMVSCAQSDQGSISVPLPPEWLTVAPAEPEFRIEQVTGALYRLRNVGTVPARRVFAQPDGSAEASRLPEGVDMEVNQSIDFLETGGLGTGTLSTLKVTWDGHPDPVYVPVP